MIQQKIKEQELYIKNNLKTYTILNQLPCEMSKISTPIVKNILDNKFKSGSDMNAVIYMFDSLFLSTAKSKKDGIFHLSVHVSKWVNKFEKINNDNNSTYVYFTDIFSDIKVIIKLSKNSDDYNGIIREYFICVTSINKLRYIIPNFVYTFGAFMCPFSKNKLNDGDDGDVDSVPFLVFERIPGDTMQKMLKTNKIDFSQYLGMFIQILLALEVAQRTIGFTHFDFHDENLMCRTIKDKCNYVVPLDNNMYEVTATEYLPVIIDFGLSTVRYNDVTLGSYEFPEYGMKHYMLQGVDMFKFLLYS